MNSLEKFPRYPTYAEVEASKEFHTEYLGKPAKTPLDFIWDKVADTLSELLKNPVLANALNDEQKFALYFQAGLMKYENGKMVSICPVAICDRGDGGYIVGSTPR